MNSNEKDKRSDVEAPAPDQSDTTSEDASSEATAEDTGKIPEAPADVNDLKVQRDIPNTGLDSSDADAESD